ncbi:hypothetical protein WJX75_000610 [Coccomyxa subellipsoidea]|uniref:ARM repeat-containing protein n=1 Tax=Coccomyxa subellipsoidea TaxID=248742 RepID=A0ABR2YV56_9CHLO
MAASSTQSPSWDGVIVGEAAWDDESPIVRVGIASLAAACLRTRLQQSQQLTAGAGTGMSKQQESPGQADDILDLQNMTMHAVAKLRQQLLHETTPDALTSLMKLMSRTTINKNAQQPDSRPALKQPLIVELEEDPSPKMSAASQNQVPSREDGSILSRAADVLLVSALHSTDGQLDAPWASAGTSSAAASVLECLAGHIGATRSSKKATRGMNGRSASRNELASTAVQAAIVELLPSAIPRLSSVLVHTPEQQKQKARMEAFTGPGAFKRAVAAQQLAWCVRRVGYSGLGPLVGFALPVILAAADDTSPAVQRQGLWALHHLAKEALPADLLWQKEALLKAARKSLVGCDESAWPAAAAAACALAVTLGGREIFCTGYEQVLGEMLTQGNSYAHVPARRIVWLQAAQPLLQAMGLASVRSFSRLLPLLLDWVHAPDVDTRLAALPVLHAVLKHTWPRLPAHASIIWQHVAQEFARDIEFVQKAGQRVGAVSEAMDGEASTNGLDSTKHSADISIQGQMAADSGKRQVLIDWQQRILEVLWWGGE